MTGVLSNLLKLDKPSVYSNKAQFVSENQRMGTFSVELGPKCMIMIFIAYNNFFDVCQILVLNHWFCDNSSWKLAIQTCKGSLYPSVVLVSTTWLFWLHGQLSTCLWLCFRRGFPQTSVMNTVWYIVIHGTYNNHFLQSPLHYNGTVIKNHQSTAARVSLL